MRFILVPVAIIMSMTIGYSVYKAHSPGKKLRGRIVVGIISIFVVGICIPVMALLAMVLISTLLGSE